MLRTANEILGYTIQSLDGEIGRVDDYYFDDMTWMIRYLVVDTGSWFSGNKVLLPPHVIQQPDWESKTLPVLLSKSQIEASPGIDLEKPVSRQLEQTLYSYYGWAPYWMTYPGGLRPMPVPFTTPADSHQTLSPSAELVREAQLTQTDSFDPNLRSLDEVTGYHIRANDGEIGHVEAFIVDDVTWSIMYVVVDTRNWLPGKKVLASLQWIVDVDWAGRLVHVDLQRETIKNSPEYDPSELVNRDYETVLYDYYGRPHYWQES